MRHIGSLSNEAQARFFTDFLLSRDIRSHIEADSDRTWSIWVRDEDQIAEAQQALTRFQANPTAPEFQKAPEAAAKARQAEAEDLEKYRRRVKSGRNVFPKMGGYGVGFLTFTLILVCVSISAFSAFGSDHEWLRKLFISDPQNPSPRVLPEVLHGEIWRLFTPIFMHANLLTNPLHLIFNMMWLYQLGSMIEARKSSLFLFFFVAISAALSNLAQYFLHGPNFYGMSGVVYALAGYVWIAGKYYPASGLYLDRQSVMILLIWLAACFTGLLGPVANTAHLAGLLVGMAWGGASAYFGIRRPE
jgi:GlpG protein